MRQRCAVHSAARSDSASLVLRVTTSRAKTLAIDAGTGQHLSDGLGISRLVSLVEALEFELRCGARDRETLRHRRALPQHSRKIRLQPDRREIDATVMKTIGIHQARNQTKRQVAAGAPRRGKPDTPRVTTY